ncbi:p53 and DNA damage-regulated protein 1-like [Ruditapes philippinarum]|uniref:p53 and DNA damage-regulated protein 1-like n=1 Tax=Ruditapes philippinarum TaxID=129788 RepID=UPI00295B56AB|nr:p53 and DNA damage-regulated protein 1-like [Ruditapes philippinarum]XP_060579008.1 p53 and DNA damage-regulated protein 1-like [Ruditapes philippinarum]
MGSEEIGMLTQHLREMELVAEDILTDRQQIIDLDRKRQKTREAVRVLSKDKKTKKQWVCFGDMFIKFPSDKTKKMLEQDFDKLDTEIGDLRRNLKPKVNKLRDLEMKEDIKGFDLNPLSKEELRTIDGYCN